MRVYLFLIVIFISSDVFCQSDSINKTKEIFSITYRDNNQKTVEVEDVNITYSDSSSLMFQNWVYDVIKSKGSTESHFINFKSISTIGYKSGVGGGSRFGIGFITGFGIGFTIGLIAGKFNPVGDSQESNLGDRFVTGTLFGTVLGIPAGLIGLLTGIGSKEYEVVDISKYDTAKKYEVITRMMKKGFEKN